jgi:hypothetical protein
VDGAQGRGEEAPLNQPTKWKWVYPQAVEAARFLIAGVPPAKAVREVRDDDEKGVDTIDTPDGLPHG